MPSSADEGFEDSRSGDFTRSPPLSQVPFIDFRKSKETRREEVIQVLLQECDIKYCISKSMCLTELAKASQQRRRIIGNDKAGLYGMVGIGVQPHTL